MKDNGNILPSSSGLLAKSMPSSQIDAVNDIVKPIVESLLEKATSGTNIHMRSFQLMRRHE